MMSLEGIIEFVAVADHNGFSAAARRLNVTVSHVSRRVQALENHLGLQLFVRNTRKVRLTEAGADFYQTCRDALNSLEDSQNALTSKQVTLTGPLRVSAAGEFVETHVVPVLIDFVKQHEGLTLELDINARPVNFIDEGYDFALRYGQLADSRLIARKLVSRSLIALASKRYLSAKGEPTHPHDLIAHNCILTNNTTWFFQDQGNRLAVTVQGQWRSNSGRSIVQACKADLGIAYMPRSSFGAALHDPDLKPILTNYWLNDSTTWIVYENKRHLPARARHAIQHLRQHFKTWEEEEISGLSFPE